MGNKYNIIVKEEKVIGFKENLISYLKDQLSYTIENVDEEGPSEALVHLIAAVKSHDDDELLLIEENAMDSDGFSLVIIM